ncbi:hypothetical protein IDG68_14990, partial [Staphylococcus sp. EG-SA-21]|nr:hypothetical protein [Staphylococcus sp. EG-SA-21]
EIEKYSHIPDKKAILYHNTEGEDISVTYQQLIEQSNKVGNVLVPFVNVQIPIHDNV